jgi:ribose/xylose/arabinose/galactoside ABC-type transport system permease subunit
MFITTTLTGIAAVAVTGTAIGTAAGIVIRPRIERMIATIKEQFTSVGRKVATTPDTPSRTESSLGSHHQ